MKHTRILILSARNEVKLRLAAYDAGAVDYIAKPFHDQEVLTKVRTWLKTIQAREVEKIWCDLEDARDGIGRTLTSLVELRDTETGEHLFRMRWYSQILAEQLAVAGPYQYAIDDTFLKRLYREAGISNASSHSGRRTLITRLAERGVDLKAIAEIAGHSSIRTTAVYVESNPRRLARILQDVTW